MTINSTKILLTNTMMIGVIMTICSNNWISMWMGLEMSLMSFLPMMQNKNTYSSESMMKYFIIQSMASTMFLISVIIMLVGDNMKNEMILIMSLSMLIKIGMTPFHTWVILIIESMNFFSIMILLTVMKIQPMFIMYQINTKFILIPAFMGMIISALMCLNQSSMRKTIGYSSIFNMSLMILTINKVNMFCIYIMIYSMTLLMLIQTLKINKINFLNQMVFNEFSIWIKLNLWMNMMSMGGFPPLLGFMGKLLIIQILTMNNQFLLMLTLMMSSMMVLLFYSRMVFTSMLTSFTAKKWLNSFNSNWYYIMTLNFLITPMMISMTSIL